MSKGHSKTTEPKMRQSGYLLCAEAARKVGVTPQTMYKWVDQGKVAGFRAGYRRYVKWVLYLATWVQPRALRLAWQSPT